MTTPKTYPELEEFREETFDGELSLEYHYDDGLEALHELCSNERYSLLRQRIVKLTIRGVKGPNFDNTEYFLSFWNDITTPGTLPELKEIDITYEAKRSKYVVKDADFELPTEEWFRVNSQGYIESFRQGEEDIEYEYPSELLQLGRLKQLLIQNDKQNCEVFLTTRVTWKWLRDDDATVEQNGHESLQSVTFRVVVDDVESIERHYQ